jgi:multidrug efflux pump subunit AcrB
MEKLFRFFVENWRFSLVMTIATVIVGILGASLMQREAFPPVNFARVIVTSVYPGASPEEVRDKVTQVIENELRGISGIKDVRSVSQPERSEIDIRIDIDTSDSDKVVNEIQRAVQRASSKLPSDMLEDPLVLEDKAEEVPVLELGIAGPSENRMRDKLAEDLESLVESVSGVSDVVLTGYTERELQVLLDRENLDRLAVGLTEVLGAISTQLKNVPVGYLETKAQSTQVRILGKSTSPEEIGEFVVRSSSLGTAIRVKDVGKVVDGGAKPRVLARLNGEPATLLIATKAADADALEVLGRVQSKVAQFQSRLPEGYKLVVYNDEGRRIANRLDIVLFNAGFGLLAVLVVLFLFLPGKVGVASAMSLPICALGSLALMVYFGANFNIITMVALVICLGNLVDNSVVISEYYTRLREEGQGAQAAAIDAARQFWVPFTASTITIISAFVPMLVTQGVMGQFIRWIPIVVAIALSLSLLESLTLLPARLQFLDPQKKSKQPDSQMKQSWFLRVENAFGRFIALTLKWRFITLASLTLLIFSGIFVTLKFNRFELFPDEGVEYYVARFDTPTQTTVKGTDAAGSLLSDAIHAALGSEIVDSLVTRSGIQQVFPGDPLGRVGENVGFVLIGIKPDKASELNAEEVLATLRAIPVPAGARSVTFEALENGPPVGKPVTATFSGADHAEIRTAADALKGFLTSVDGALNIADDEDQTGMEHQLRLLPEQAAYSGVSVDTVGLNLRTALEGTSVGKLTGRGKEYDAVVKFQSSDREELQDLLDADILNARGNLVPLARIATVERKPAPVTQRAFEFQRSITVTADIDVNKVTAAALNSRAQAFVDEQKKAGRFQSVAFKLGGEEESTNESLASLAVALVLAIFGIFATLVFTFRSFSRPLLILSTIPLGLVGVFYAFAFSQKPLSFLAFIGVVGLSGVVINSAIILVDFIDELQRTGKFNDLSELLITASARRLRAVLATGLTTVVGLVPTAFGWGGFDALLVPITLALSWGMIVGTVLSLIWIPAGYLVLQDIRGMLMRRFQFLSRD